MPFPILYRTYAECTRQRASATADHAHILSAHDTNIRNNAVILPCLLECKSRLGKPAFNLRDGKTGERKVGDLSGRSREGQGKAG